jgi:uncharacterized iron-regulated membrane protein
MPVFVRIWTRKIHRWAALITALPFLIVIVTGILLQVKKEYSWIQPPTTRGVSTTPTITFEQILEAVKTVPEAEVQSWQDIDRVDVRMKDGVAKVQCKNRWEVQIDFTTAELKQTAYRRSDFIETIHDGSWFHDSAKLWIFLPSAILVFLMWVTGVYLWILPNWVRWTRKPIPPARRD